MLPLFGLLYRQIYSSPTFHEWEYSLRFRNQRPELGRTNSLSVFVIVKYQHIV